MKEDLHREINTGPWEMRDILIFFQEEGFHTLKGRGGIFRFL
jgi:hypothetical protein